MKKLILFAALMMAAVAGANAQATKEPMPNDSVSVMFRHLEQTNDAMLSLDKAMKTHAVMVAGGSLVMFGGLAYAIHRYEQPYPLEPSMTADGLRTGLMVAAAGAVVVAASFIPLARSRVKIDGRGLIIPLH